jgi:hypothetical protein
LEAVKCDPQLHSSQGNKVACRAKLHIHTCRNTKVYIVFVGGSICFGRWPFSICYCRSENNILVRI